MILNVFELYWKGWEMSRNSPKNSFDTQSFDDLWFIDIKKWQTISITPWNKINSQTICKYPLEYEL